MEKEIDTKIKNNISKKERRLEGDKSLSLRKKGLCMSQRKKENNIKSIGGNPKDEGKTNGRTDVRQSVGSLHLGQSIIQGVLAIAIIITSSLIVINTITPTLQEGQSFQEFDKAKQLMSVVDSVIRELAVEASGAARIIQITSDFGSFSVAGRENRLRFTLDSKTALLEPGTTQQEGNLLISSGVAMRAYETDIDSDSALDLVLENDAVTLAVKKIGSPSSYSTINTSSLVTRIENKQGNVNLTNPRTRIYIGDNITTSFGTGYTELSRAGGTLTESSIKAFVNSTAGRQYEIIFTLSSTKDFVELQVQNVV